MKKYYFWGIIGFGFLMPFLVNTVIQIWFEPKNYFKLFIATTPGLLLLGLFNAIPFIVISFLIKSLYKNQKAKSLQSLFKHKVGVIVTALITFIIILIINIDIWLGIALHKPGSSTSSITYFFLPFFIGIIMPIVYFLGLNIGRIILWKQSESGNKFRVGSG